MNVVLATWLARFTTNKLMTKTLDLKGCDSRVSDTHWLHTNAHKRFKRKVRPFTVIYRIQIAAEQICNNMRSPAVRNNLVDKYAVGPTIFKLSDLVRNMPDITAILVLTALIPGFLPRYRFQYHACVKQHIWLCCFLDWKPHILRQLPQKSTWYEWICLKGYFSRSISN